MAKADPTKQARAEASKKSRENPGKPFYIDHTLDGYKVRTKFSHESVMVYKNGNEIAL